MVRLAILNLQRNEKSHSLLQDYQFLNYLFLRRGQLPLFFASLLAWRDQDLHVVGTASGLVRTRRQPSFLIVDECHRGETQRAHPTNRGIDS